MKISIEKKAPNKEGKQALRLVCYYGSSIDPETGKRIRHRQREQLDLYVYHKPSSPLHRQHNKEAMRIAEAIKSKRVLESQSSKHGFGSAFAKSANFYDYFEKVAEARLKASSRSNYSSWMGVLRHLKLYHNEPVLTFDQLTPQFLNGFREYLLKTPVKPDGSTLSQNSASAYFNRFRTALLQAQRDGICQENLVKNIQTIRQTTNKREYLTLDELKALAKAECRFDVLKRAFLFSCMTGLRWSDVQKLIWDDVQELSGTPRIIFRQKKTGGLQYLDISQQAFQLMGERREPNSKVFTNLKYSSWHNVAMIHWMARAGIKKHVTFHCARHTFAVLQLTVGTDIYTVSKLLGHSDLKTTQIYTDIVEQKRKEAMLRVPNFIESC